MGIYFELGDIESFVEKGEAYSERHEEYRALVSGLEEARGLISQFGDSVKQYQDSGDVDSLKAIAATWPAAQAAYEDLKDISHAMEENLPGAVMEASIRETDLNTEALYEVREVAEAYQTHNRMAERAAVEGFRDHGFDVKSRAQEVAETSGWQNESYFEPIDASEIAEEIQEAADEHGIDLTEE